MSRPQSKRDLAEAGRRKLEAFRAQKAAAKALKDAPANQPASPLQEHRTFMAVSTAGPASETGSDSLSRAPSVLPLSTHAGPISYGGSDEGAPDSCKLLTCQDAGKATAQSVPKYPVSCGPEPPVRIPFTGRDSTGSTDSSSTVQNPQSAGSAAVPATSDRLPAVPAKYQSRLPPPPPVFKPRVRSQAGTAQSLTTDNSGSVPLSSPLPFQPAVLLGATKAVSSAGQDQAGQAPVRPQIQMFHPAKADVSRQSFQQQAAPPSTTTATTSAAAATTAARPTGSRRHAWSLFGGAQVTQEPAASTAAASANDASAEAAEAAARLSHAEEASQLTLANERQVLPEVLTGQDVDKTDRSPEPGKVPDISHSSGMASAVSEQVDGNPPDSRSKKAILPTFPESPDSPLVFPWSQGPSSTGAASAYASLSDSYLSRPPSQPLSQTPSQPPSQAPSPSKKGQLASAAAASPAKRASHASSGSLSAQQEPAGTSSPAHRSHSIGSSPSQIHKSPLDDMWATSGFTDPSPVHQSASSVGQVGSPSRALGRPFQALPNGHIGSPSGPPLPIGHAFQGHSSGYVSDGPVSVAPWRQQPHSATSTTARPQSPPLGSPAATASLQSPQLRSPTATATLQLSPGKLPPTQASHHLTDGQQPSKAASDATGHHAMTEQSALQHEARFPWQKQRPASNGGLQLNSGRISHDDAASSASGDSSFAAASSHAGAPAGATAGVALQELEMRNGSTHTLHKGLGSHTSLADSLANAAPPVKTSNFTALQQHIDDLTKEKFELVRGLQEQQKMAASLAEENQLVTDDFNRQAEALQQTRRELSQLEEEVREQLVALEQLTAERDACKSGAHEASDRSKSLAAEVVALEEKVLQTRSREIRLQKGIASLQEGLQQAEKQLQASRRDRANLQSTIDMLQEEKGTLLAKLRQEASCRDSAAALGQHQPALPTDAAPQHAQHAQAPLSNDLQQTSAVHQDAAALRGAETASSSSSEGAANRQKGSAGMSTSARLVEQVLDSRQDQLDQFGAIAIQDALPESLASLLPASFSGDEGAVAGEQQQLLQSIHAMIGNLEAEKRSYLHMLDSSQAELQDLRSANSELQRKLESQTQRLELAIQQQAHASPHAFTPSSSYVAQRTHQQSEPVAGQPNPQLWPNSPVRSASLQQQQRQQQPLAHGESGLQLQSEEQQQQQQGSYSRPAGDARSAPPTPQHEEARKSLRVSADKRPSGVLGWLGNIIAPRPPPQQQELTI